MSTLLHSALLTLTLSCAVLSCGDHSQRAESTIPSESTSLAMDYEAEMAEIDAQRAYDIAVCVESCDGTDAALADCLGKEY